MKDAVCGTGGGEREEKELGRGASEPLLPNTGWSMYLLCLLQQDEEERKQREAEAAKKKEQEGGAEEEDEEFDDEEVRKQISVMVIVRKITCVSPYFTVFRGGR